MGNTVEQWRASIGSLTTRDVLTARTFSRVPSKAPWFLLLVILVLLVIGGIEMNPGPDNVLQSQSEKTAGAASIAGVHFETKMATLLFLRGLNSNKVFHIDCNKAAAGTFDDLVFTMGHQTAFLQLKHKQNKNAKVHMSQLLKVKGDFSLLKYCKSYLDVKRKWEHNKDLQYCGKFEDSLFIIYTNASFAGDSNVDSSVMHELLNTKGSLIQFTKQQHEQIYSVFDSLPRYKQLLIEAVNAEQVSNTPELLEVVQKLLNNNAKSVPGKKDLVKLLDDVKSLGDLSEYTKFLSQLFFYTKQTRESGLENLIRSELDTLFGNDEKFLELKEGIEKWWKKPRINLTCEAKFFKDMIQKIAANITEHVSTLKLKFIEEECDKIRQKLTSDCRMLYIYTECINLSSVKVLQSLQTSLLVDVSTLQTHLNEVLAVWRFGECDVLVVVVGDTTDTSKPDTSILHKFASMPNSKNMVVISSTEPTQLYEQFGFVSFTDSFCLSQLDPDTQLEVLEHEIIFQGFPVKLNSLADNSFLQNVITADVVVQLPHALDLGHKLDDMDPCYIPRTFLRREYVSEQIFREEHITVAVTGISEDGLTRVIPHGEKIQKINLNNFSVDKNCKYFHIEGEAEFSALCGVHDNIHWIEACEGGFLWKKSKGDMSPVMKSLEQKCTRFAGAKEIVALSHQVTVIVAEPGMGKSTEMCNIAHTIKQNNPSTWVLRIDLNKHTALLSDNHDNAVEFLETFANLNTEFQKCLFKYQLQNNGNAVILLDGFDEIATNYSEKVFLLLKKFSENGINKIFVTSRSVALEQLQQELSTLAFSFQSFTPDDQENFLRKYWNQTDRESFNLSNFISSLLQLLGTSLNDKLKSFTGIPLQCKMVAEVFQDEALLYCQTGEIRVPKSLDVLQLYDKFIDKKWEVYCKKLNVDMNNYMLRELIQKQELLFQKNLRNCAMVSYFDHEYIKCLMYADCMLKQNKDFIEEFNKGQDKTGIVIDVINDKAVFVHRTFTEYFAAKWLSESFHLELDNVKKIYFDRNFEIVQKFLDRILAQQNKLHTAVLNEDLHEVGGLLSMQNADVNEKDKGGRTALHLSVMNYYYSTKDDDGSSIIETLLEKGADVKCEDDVLHWRPLRLAEEIRAWSVVDKLLGKQADSTDLVWIRANIERQVPVEPENIGSDCEMTVQYRMSDALQDVMYIALSKGYVNLVEFVLKCGVSVEHYISVIYVHETSMLHIAAKHRDLRLMQILIEKGADVDVMSGRYERTPLMEAAVSGNVDVAELLVNHGASINLRDKDGDTTLSLAAGNGKDKVVELLLQKEADVNITSGVYKRTPLMDAAVSGHVHVAELLINHGASVNIPDTHGHSALSLASLRGNYEVVHLLLQKKADVHIFDMYNRTPLAWAARCGHKHIVELLIEHGASVNARDKVENTILSLAAGEGKYEVVELLLQNGADVDIPDTYKRTPLTWAARSGHKHIAELLIYHGASVNGRDKFGDTILSLAASEGKYEVVELLLKKGADVNISGRCSRTPLMWAAWFGHVQVVELLVNNGASINARDEDGNTALSLAVGERKDEVEQLLLKKGANAGS